MTPSFVLREVIRRFHAKDLTLTLIVRVVIRRFHAKESWSDLFSNMDANSMAETCIAAVRLLQAPNPNPNPNPETCIARVRLLQADYVTTPHIDCIEAPAQV